MYRVKTPPRLRTLLLALIALSIGAFGLSPHLGPLRIEVSDAGLELRAGFWLGRGASLELSLVEGVELWEALPAFEQRLSGYSLAGRVRGEFVLAGFGEVFAFLENDRPPYVFVRGRLEPSTAEIRLLASHSEPEATRRLFRELSALTGAIGE